MIGRMIEELTQEILAENVNTKFRLRVEGDPAPELELVEVKGEERLRAHGIENFSAVFRSEPDVFLQQGIYPLAHDRIGDFEIFLVPIKPNASGYFYEAVFNRLLDR